VINYELKSGSIDWGRYNLFNQETRRKVMKCELDEQACKLLEERLLARLDQAVLLLERDPPEIIFAAGVARYPELALAIFTHTREDQLHSLGICPCCERTKLVWDANTGEWAEECEECRIRHEHWAKDPSEGLSEDERKEIEQDLIESGILP
jgi:ribosomal protein L37AE/L43A